MIQEFLAFLPLITINSEVEMETIQVSQLMNLKKMICLKFSPAVHLVKKVSLFKFLAQQV